MTLSASVSIDGGTLTFDRNGSTIKRLERLLKYCQEQHNLAGAFLIGRLIEKGQFCRQKAMNDLISYGYFNYGQEAKAQNLIDEITSFVLRE